MVLLAEFILGTPVCLCAAQGNSARASHLELGSRESFCKGRARGVLKTARCAVFPLDMFTQIFFRSEKIFAVRFRKTPPRQDCGSFSSAGALSELPNLLRPHSPFPPKRKHTQIGARSGGKPSSRHHCEMSERILPARAVTENGVALTPFERKTQCTLR